jgi:hypothetical protein
MANLAINLDRYGHDGHNPSMTLIEYIRANGLTYKGFALLVGASGARTIHRYATGRRIPSPTLMRSIVEKTQGAVTANDFYHPADEAQPQKENEIA